MKRSSDSEVTRGGRARSPRVLLVEANEDGTVGGSHQVLFDVVTRVDLARFVPVVCFYQNNEYADRLRSSGHEVHTLEEFRTLERARRARRSFAARVGGIGQSVQERVKLIRAWRIDLVHLNNSPHVGFSDWLPAARVARVPVVVAAMGDADPARGRLRRKLVASFDHYLPVSHYMARALLAQGVDPKRITTVQNGVDLPAIRSRLHADDRERIRAELEIPSDAAFGVMVGNIRPWKGQHVVLDALGRMTSEDRRWVVAFAGSEDPGDSSYGEALRGQARTLGIEAQVRWLGRRSDVPNLFHAADVGIHASVIPEPFGLVMVECMAAGTPVIAAQEGGAAEIVTDSTGWTYPGGDAAALADRLREAGSQSSMEARARREADARHAEAFDAVRMALQVQSVWEGFTGPTLSAPLADSG